MARTRLKRKEEQMNVGRAAARSSHTERRGKSKSNRFQPSIATTEHPCPRPELGKHTVAFSDISSESMGPIQLHVEVTPELAAIVEGLAERQNVDAATIMHRAIILLGIASSAVRDGLKFGMAQHDQDLVTEITGL